MKKISFLAFLILSNFCYSQTIQKVVSKNFLLKKYANIPSGILVYGNAQKPDSVASFYISKNEISNEDYRIFLNDIKDKVSNAEWNEVKIDSTKWNLFGINQPYMTYYFSHPAYANYPCVNMSQKGARKYCEWLQQKLSKDNAGFSFIVRLPTATEWQYAASGGKKNSTYPWGNTSLKNKSGQALCNYKKRIT